MESEVAQRLIALNARFYQSFAAAFSATRERLQPGVMQVLARIPPEAAVLDLGCGNGTLAMELEAGGHQGKYVGLDFSEGLLKVARLKVEHEQYAFMQADLTGAGWAQQAGISEQQFDFVLAFAFLHHIPGDEIRRSLLRQLRGLLAPAGRVVLSNWQFLNSERLRGRIQPWEAAGILDEEVDEWDYLLDWRRGGEGLRYVHYFTEEQLEALAAESGFEIVESFYSDGETGDLGLYQVWALGKDEG